MQYELNEYEWQRLLQDIGKKNQVVLLLGQEFSSNHREEMIKYVIDKKDSPVYKPERDGLFIFEKRKDKTNAKRYAEEFYNKLFVVDPHLIQKIVELPISLIISLNPDAVLKKAFKQFQLPYQFSFFSIENTIDNGEIKEITADNPLIYNLWGSVDHHDSIILDYEDIFKLMELLNRNLEAPNAKIKSVLKEAQNFICIGFRFDIWYTHWLLRYLNMYEKEFNNNTTNYLVKTTLHSEDIKIFLYKQFNVQFISADTSFLEELHRRYAAYLRFQPDEAAPMRKINDAHLNLDF